MSDKKKLPNYKIITDIPLNTYAEDDITVKAQLKLAQSIKEVMLNSQVQSVALYGQWGSGKSTVVKMLAKELAINDGEIVFDFWNHAGDKLRSTFLETLLCKIGVNNLTIPWDDECTKESEKQKVSILSLVKGSYHKIETVETTTPLSTSQIIVTSLILGFILTFVVLPNFFSAGDLYKYISLGIGIYKVNLLGWGIILLLLGSIAYSSFPAFSKLISCKPNTVLIDKVSSYRFNLSFIKSIVTLLVLGLIILFIASLSSFGSSNAHKYLYVNMLILKLLGWIIVSTFSGLLAFKCFPNIGRLVSRKLNVNSVNKISKSTTQQNDLSENDFKKLYHEILKKITKNKKYVLLCLDNLDRISSEQARTVIDDLYLFIQEAKECEYLKLVVPVDNSALDNLNSNFMHKLFPIKFRLLDIINLHWRDLMRNTLTKAGFTEKQDHIITIIDKCRRSSGVTTITPRDIVYYINTLITISYEADGLTEINLEDIARYVGLAQFHSRSAIVDFFKKAYTPKENKKDASSIENFFEQLSEKERVNLFKIHYQTDTPYQTLYSDDIVSWVTNGDVDSIDKLKECLKMPNSIEVFTTVINESYTKFSELDNQIKLYKVVSTVFTEAEQKTVVDKLTAIWQRYLDKERFLKWDVDFANAPIYKMLLWLAQHDSGSLKASIIYFWKWEIVVKEDKTLVLLKPNVLDNARKAYWQFLKTVDNKSFLSMIISSFYIHQSIAFDELNDDILQIIAKYYPTQLTKLLENTLNTDMLGTSYVKIDLVYSACGHLNNDDDKETSYNNASELIKGICTKINAIANTTQFLYLSKIVIESLFYLKDKYKKTINPQYTEAIKAFKTVTIKSAMLTQFLGQIGYQDVVTKFYIVMADTDEASQNIASQNLPNNLPVIYSLLETKYSKHSNEFMKSVSRFTFGTVNYYDDVLSHFKNNYASCKDIWTNLIKKDSAKYIPVLPKEAFEDEAMRSILKNSFIDLLNKKPLPDNIIKILENAKLTKLKITAKIRQDFVDTCNANDTIGQEALSKLNELFPSTRGKKPTKTK